MLSVRCTILAAQLSITLPFGLLVRMEMFLIFLARFVQRLKKTLLLVQIGVSYMKELTRINAFVLMGVGNRISTSVDGDSWSLRFPAIDSF